MTDTGRLGFAIQLKFRQIYGYYPESAADIPSGVAHRIADSLYARPFLSIAIPFRGGKLSDTGNVSASFWE